MSAPAPQVIQLSCPNCRTPMRAQVFPLVDVGMQPELKNYLLAGQLNMAVCPNCGTPAMIAAPLIYHDPNKQLFLVHFPQQLNARPEEQERFIGDATSLIMRALPQDKPKGYLLAPKRFLTLNSLVDVILEADGISREVIEAQRQRVTLISQLAEAFEQGEEQLAAAVAQNKEALDYDFFATLTAFAEASMQGGRDESGQLLMNLREKLIELTGFNASDLQLEAGEELEDVDLEEVISRLVDAPDVELEQTIAELRPAIDYGFFEALTTRINSAEQAGDTATAERLTTRRALMRPMQPRRYTPTARRSTRRSSWCSRRIWSPPSVPATRPHLSDWPRSSGWPAKSCKSRSRPRIASSTSCCRPKSRRKLPNCCARIPP